MSGTNNALQLQALIQTIDNHNLVSGNPGNFTVSLLHPAMVSTLTADTVAASTVPAISYGQAAIVEAAVTKTNAAAAATPSAASGNSTTASTPVEVVTNIFKGLNAITSAPKDIQTMEAGASATLNWWGWSLVLNESATQAFLDLLGNDLADLGTILAAFAAISAPLAAAGAIVAAVSTGLDKWISAADANKKGVTINGYLWVGVWVQGN